MLVKQVNSYYQVRHCANKQLFPYQSQFKLSERLREKIPQRNRKHKRLLKRFISYLPYSQWH